MLLRTLWVKRNVGRGTPTEILSYLAKNMRDMLFEVVNFVATTRRWHDRGDPRDAGAATPAKQSLAYSGDHHNSVMDFLYYYDVGVKSPTIVP